MHVAMVSSTACWCLFVLTILVATAIASPPDEVACAETSEIARLEVLTATSGVDEPVPSPVGWLLICDDSDVVWKAPVGSIQEAETWHFESSCIELGSTCVFRISTSTNTFYTLTFGAATVARSAHQDFDRNSSQTEEIFCFGPNCATAPLERLRDSMRVPSTNGDSDVMWKYFLTRKSFVIWLFCLVASVTMSLGLLYARFRSSVGTDVSDEKTIDSNDTGTSVADPSF